MAEVNPKRKFSNIVQHEPMEWALGEEETSFQN